MENLEKNEVLSRSVRAGKRTYFFDVKTTKNDEKYLTITESKRKFDEMNGTFTYEKHKLFLYKEDFEKFQKGLANAFSFIETGIEPEPVVVENDYHEFDSEKHESSQNNFDDIDFKY